VIEGLERALEGWAPEGAPELERALVHLLGGAGVRGRLAQVERLPRDRVLRVRVEIDGKSRGLIVKRLPLDRAHRERAAIERWLPRVGLEAHGPPLLLTVAEPSGRCAWFVYEDLGECTLAKRMADPACARAAVELVAELHVRFRAHPLLGEARSLGADLGMPFYAASVRDAMRALEVLLADAALRPEHRALGEGLLERLARLRDEEAERAAQLAAFGGPETLLHGDLWTVNVLVPTAASGFEIRLIDWDHAGVGPVSYDLSAFLLRFPLEQRAALLAHYESRSKLAWPGRADWNRLFDTTACARLANGVLWRALAALDGHVAWAFEELAGYEEAFASLEPVLPVERRAAHVESRAAARAG
jgi:aminoglycoside/choline kinase family phosphotransferase